MISGAYKGKWTSGIGSHAVGRTPLTGDHEFPPEWRQAADVAYGVDIPTGGEPSNRSAPGLIIDQLKLRMNLVTSWRSGPLTNIAEAIQRAPEITADIREIYIMGGAINVEGNVGTLRRGDREQVCRMEYLHRPNCREHRVQLWRSHHF